MASGALLIGKEESTEHLLKNRALKYLVVLIVASVMQYLYKCYISDPQPVSVSSFFTVLYTSQMISAYWFLYAYLAYILMLPLIRRLAKNMTDREYLWMVIMFGFINILSIIDYLMWKGELVHNNNFAFFIMTSYLFYPLMGFYIDQKMDEKFLAKKYLAVLMMISVTAIIISCYMTVYRCEIIREWKQGSCEYFYNTLIFIPSITAFYGAKLLFYEHKPDEKMSRIISAVGSTVFGVFLVENILRDITLPVFYLLNLRIGCFLAGCIWILVAGIAGFAVIYALKRVPVFRKYL